MCSGIIRCIRVASYMDDSRVRYVLVLQFAHMSRLRALWRWCVYMFFTRTASCSHCELVGVGNKVLNNITRIAIRMYAMCNAIRNDRSAHTIRFTAHTHTVPQLYTVRITWWCIIILPLCLWSTTRIQLIAKYVLRVTIVLLLLVHVRWPSILRVRFRHTLLLGGRIMPNAISRLS